MTQSDTTTIIMPHPSRSGVWCTVPGIPSDAYVHPILADIDGSLWVAVYDLGYPDVMWLNRLVTVLEREGETVPGRYIATVMADDTYADGRYITGPQLDLPFMPRIAKFFVQRVQWKDPEGGTRPDPSWWCLSRETFCDILRSDTYDHAVWRAVADKIRLSARCDPALNVQYIVTDRMHWLMDDGALGRDIAWLRLSDNASFVISQDYEEDDMTRHIGCERDILSFTTRGTKDLHLVLQYMASLVRDDGSGKPLYSHAQIADSVQFLMVHGYLGVGTDPGEIARHTADLAAVPAVGATPSSRTTTSNSPGTGPSIDDLVQDVFRMGSMGRNS